MIGASEKIARPHWWIGSMIFLIQNSRKHQDPLAGAEQ
jgi:hypothetical protein